MAPLVQKCFLLSKSVFCYFKTQERQQQQQQQQIVPLKKIAGRIDVPGFTSAKADTSSYIPYQVLF